MRITIDTKAIGETVSSKLKAGAKITLGTIEFGAKALRLSLDKKVSNEETEPEQSNEDQQG